MSATRKPSDVGLEEIWNAIEPTGYAKSGDLGSLESLALAFFASLIALLGFLVFKRVFPLFRRSNQLRKLTEKLRREWPDVPKKPILEPDKWEYQIWPLVKEIPWLEDEAGEFEEQCWKDYEGHQRNAHQANGYFTEDQIDPGLRGFGAAAPGLLTAIGILGTFVGITIGLGEINLGGGSKDITDSIKGLVDSLGVSFRTSIWGLILSMAATWLLNWAESSLKRARLEFVNWINGALERGTEHDLLQELDLSLKSLRGVTEEGKGELQQLAESLAQAFENAILGTETGGKRTGGLAELITQTQTTGVDLMLDTFVKNMNEQMGDQFANLGTSMGAMVDANTSYQATMGALVNQLEQATTAQSAAASDMSSAVGETARAITDIRETVSALSGSAETIQTAADKVGTVLDRQSSVADRQQSLSEELVSGLQAQKEGWGEHQRAIQETYGSLEGKFEELRDALVALTAWHDRVKEELSGQLESWHASLEVQDGLTQTIAAERAGVTTMLERLGQATDSLSGLRAGLEGLAQKLQTDLSEIQGTQKLGEERLTRATGELAQAGEEMRDSWKQYVEVAQALSQTLPDITQLLDGLRQSVGMQRQVVDAGQEVARQLQGTAESQQTIRHSFEAVARAGDATRAALEPTAQAISDGAESLGGAVDGLRDVQSSAKDLVRTLEQNSIRLMEAEDANRHHWAEVNDGVARTTKELDQGMSRYSQEVNKNLTVTLQGFDEALAVAVRTLGTTVMGLQEVVDSIASIKPPDGSDEL